MEESLGGPSTAEVLRSCLSLRRRVELLLVLGACLLLAQQAYTHGTGAHWVRSAWRRAHYAEGHKMILVVVSGCPREVMLEELRGHRLTYLPSLALESQWADLDGIPESMGSIASLVTMLSGRAVHDLDLAGSAPGRAPIRTITSIADHLREHGPVDLKTTLLSEAKLHGVLGPEHNLVTS